jgi:para-aminobenzoate synthetase/4-amino-4-deoxychorismate lyase
MDTVFALLDDASAEAHAQALSRLYLGHAGTLQCVDAAGWDALLDELQAALARGLYAVPLLTYELGAQLLGIHARPQAAPLAQVLLFERCERLTAEGAAAWVATRAAGDGPGNACARASRCRMARSLACPTAARCCPSPRSCSCATAPAPCWRAR